MSAQDDLLAQLLDELGAARITLRLDRPENPYFPIVAEALAPGVASLQGETLVELRQSAPFRFLDDERRPLVQDDVLTHEVDAHRVLELFGFRSQVLVPLVRGENLVGFLSVHREGAPHAWTEAEVAAAVATGTAALASFDRSVGSVHSAGSAPSDDPIPPADPVGPIPAMRKDVTKKMIENSILLELDKVEWTPIEEIWGTAGVPMPMPGAQVSIIRQDPETGSTTALTKLPAGWHDKTTHYHHSEEETVVLAGDVSFFGTRYDAPAYYAIPPLEVHGHCISVNGCTLLMRFGGPVEQIMVDNGLDEG